MEKKSTINAEKVNLHIVNWLKNYAQNSKMKGFVIGISGGIDSAVTSTLCAQTGYAVLCVEMPIHQSENQVVRASEHIEQLKNKAQTANHKIQPRSLSAYLSDSTDNRRKLHHG